MRDSREKGAALILTIILIAVLSVITVSMMYLGQSETLSTHNFRLASQARDAAEAGVNMAARYIMYDYVPPTIPETASFDMTTTPVSAGGDEVTLIANSDGDVSDMYPDVPAGNTVADDYATTATGLLSSANQKFRYETVAKLHSMKPLYTYGGGEKVLQRWHIQSRGVLDAGIEPAEVQVDAYLERHPMPAVGYAAFGMSEGCGDASGPFGLQFGGTTVTDSFNSKSFLVGEGACDMSQAITTTNCALWPDAGGNIGTNGSLDVVGGSVDINGSLSSPRAGSGACTDGYAVDNPDVLEEGQIQLPERLIFEDPEFPSPTPTTAAQTFPNAISCAVIPGCVGTAGIKNRHHLKPTVMSTETAALPVFSGVLPASPTYGNLDSGPGSGKIVYLYGGTYNINSLAMGSGSIIEIVPNTGPVILNITGCDEITGTACTDGGDADTSIYMPVAISTTGGSFSNDSRIAGNFQILYGGEGTLQLRGTSDLAATVYAPSARIESVGTATFIGSVIGNEIDWTGTSSIRYDRALEGLGVIQGPWRLHGFTWKKF